MSRPQSATPKMQSTMPSSPGPMDGWNPQSDGDIKYAYSSYKLVRHKEMAPWNMEPGTVIVTIEHCSDCGLHPVTTRHDAQKYLNYRNALVEAIDLNYPFIKVFAKPTKSLWKKEAPCMADGSSAWSLGLPGSTLGRWPRERTSRGCSAPRFGALEVQMAVWPAGAELPTVHLLHSKLVTCKWPNTDNVLKGIARRLPGKQVAVTVVVQDYVDGKVSVIPPPEGLKIVAAAGSKVEEAELSREGVGEPIPMAVVAVPMGCMHITATETALTLEATQPLTDAVPQEVAKGEKGGPPLLTLVAHTKPQFHITTSLHKDAAFPTSTATIRVRKTIEFSSWAPEMPYPEESGEVWLQPPLDDEHLACTGLMVILNVGGFGAGGWQTVVEKKTHTYGITNLSVEFPALTAVRLVAQDAGSGPAPRQVEVQVAPHGNAQALKDAPWSDVEEVYVLLPGKYVVNARSDSHFDTTHVFTVGKGHQAEVAVAMRHKLVLSLGGRDSESLEVDEIPQAMLEGRSEKLGLVDVAIALEESASAAPALSAVTRTLGLSSPNPELVQSMTALLLCKSVQLGLCSYKGIPKVNPLAEGEGKQKRKSLEEEKADCASCRLPLTTNWQSLKVAAQSVDPQGGPDDSGVAINEALKLACAMTWRPAAAKLVVMVADAEPLAGGLSVGEVAAAGGAAAVERMSGKMTEGTDAALAAGVTVMGALIAAHEDKKMMKCDATVCDNYRGLAEVTGGMCGAISARGGGFLSFVVGTVECALHQQLLEDIIETTAAAPLGALASSAPAPDTDQGLAEAKAIVAGAIKEVKAALKQAGCVARRLVHHPGTHAMQLLCHEVENADVAACLRAICVRERAVTPGAAVRKVLLETRLPQWN